MAYIGSGTSRFNTADELTVTGDAIIDTTTLVVDSTNNRVGIGTSSPAGLMHLYQSSGYTPIILDGSGGGNVKFYRGGSQHAEIISDGVGGDIGADGAVQIFGIQMISR